MRGAIIRTMFVIRFRLLPDVDTVLPAVVLGNLHTVQPGRLADLRQHLGLDAVRCGSAPPRGLPSFVGMPFRRLFAIIPSVQ